MFVITDQLHDELHVRLVLLLESARVEAESWLDKLFLVGLHGEVALEDSKLQLRQEVRVQLLGLATLLSTDPKVLDSRGRHLGQHL
eukprot:2270603-Prymnesium_polylepis.1